MTRTLTILLLLLPAIAIAGPKEKEKAKAHLAKASQAHRAGNFELALAELEVAYKLDPVPDVLFALAQVYGKLGRCAEATAHYKIFLANSKDPDAKAIVDQAIAGCKPAEEPVTEKPPVVVEKVIEKVIEKPVLVEPVRSPERSPWYKDPIGDALVIAGGVALIASTVMYVGARSDVDAAEESPTLAQYNDKLDSARSKRTLSVLLIGGGAALVGGGVLRYKLRARPAMTVGVIPANDGGMVTWTGRF